MRSSSGATTWTEAGLVMIGLLGVGFLVSWVGTEVIRWSRRRYITVLAAVTLVATVVVVGVSGASVTDMTGDRWALGVGGALFTGLLGGFGMRKKEPVVQHLDTRALPSAAVWEGVVYGVAEGVLLSVLPAFIMWQAAVDGGWNDLAAWVIALGLSGMMITVHHLGYWDYRGRRVGLAITGCGLLTVGYLATGSIIAPALGHVLLHIVGITGGVQLPPHPRAGVVGAAAH